MPATRDPAVGDWFDNLRGTQQKVRKEIDQRADADLKLFSAQKPASILDTEMKQGALTAYLTTLGIPFVPSDAYNELTFGAFLDRITYSIAQSLRTLFYVTGAQFNTAVSTWPLYVIGDKTLTDVFGADPYDTNAGLHAMDADLVASVPLEFYQRGGAMLQPGALTVQQVVDAMIA